MRDAHRREHGVLTCAGAGVGDAGEEAGEVAEEVARGLLRAQLERHAGRLHDDPLRQGGLRPCSAAWGPGSGTEAGGRKAACRTQRRWLVSGIVLQNAVNGTLAQDDTFCLGALALLAI